MVLDMSVQYIHRIVEISISVLRLWGCRLGKIMLSSVFLLIMLKNKRTEGMKGRNPQWCNCTENHTQEKCECL